ncbi:MAG: hypothetical protein IJC94_06290 [Oscillospiraceae bacterium]|nr:hypothetical protein [Oscillospiraceae bacterium]
MNEPRTSNAPSDNKGFLVATSAVFRRNPVLTAGLLIGPIVAAATNLKAAAALSIAVFVMVFPAIVAAVLLKNRLRDWIVAPITILTAAGFFFLAYNLIAPISPLIFDSIGIYLPILMIAPVSIIGPGQDHLASKTRIWGIVEAFFLCLGFAFVSCLVGAIRELFSSASLWGVTIHSAPTFSAANTVFFGFIVLGFTAALFKAFSIFERRIVTFSKRKKSEKLARHTVFEEDSALGE